LKKPASSDPEPRQADQSGKRAAGKKARQAHK
jgi:hypothetical protein